MKLTAYHATTPDRAAKILAEGFRLDVEHKSDAGDFGEAAYFTTCLARAKAIGSVILEVELELGKHIRMPQTAAYALVLDQLGFDTIHGHGVYTARTDEARKARAHFLGQGYCAMISDRGRGDLEVAVYDLQAIRQVRTRKASA